MDSSSSKRGSTVKRPNVKFRSTGKNSVHACDMHTCEIFVSPAKHSGTWGSLCPGVCLSASHTFLVGDKIN